MKQDSLALLLCALSGCSSLRVDDRVDADAPADATAEIVEREAGCGVSAAPSAWAEWLMPDPTSATYDASSSDVVVDRVTGLTWQRTVARDAYAWSDASRYCTCLDLGGYDDWRLPTRIELVSLVDFTKDSPAIDRAAFPMTPGDYFWTSSRLSGEGSSAWYVYFFDGNTHSIADDSAYRVRCVRGGSAPSDRYRVQDDAVLDRRTLLTWQRAIDPSSRSFDESRAYCAALQLSGGGWRAPNMKELQTLIDESTTSPAIDATAFPDTPSEAFWTSTPLGGDAGEAWFVNFYSGVSYTSLVDHPYRTRCVR